MVGVCNLTSQSHPDPTTGPLTAHHTSVHTSTRSEVHHTVHSQNSIDRQPDHMTAMQSSRKRRKTNSNLDVCSQVSSPPLNSTTPSQYVQAQQQNRLSSSDAPDSSGVSSLPSRTAAASRSTRSSEVPPPGRDLCLPAVHDDSPALSRGGGNHKHLNGASNSKDIIRKTLDWYFDRGEITNRQFLSGLTRRCKWGYISLPA